MAIHRKHLLENLENWTLSGGTLADRLDLERARGRRPLHVHR